MVIIVLLSNKMTIACARKLGVKGRQGERKKSVKNELCVKKFPLRKRGAGPEGFDAQMRIDCFRRWIKRL